jgi:hypothetical protein
MKTFSRISTLIMGRVFPRETSEWTGQCLPEILAANNGSPIEAMPIGELRDSVQGRAERPPDQQKLACSGNQLEDVRGDCSIGSRYAIDVVFSLRGS